MVKVAVDASDEQSATVSGGLRAGGLGLGIGLVGSLLLQRAPVPAFRAYRSLTLPIKAFAVTSVTTASFIIGADAASRRFELAKYAKGSGGVNEDEAWRASNLEEQIGLRDDGPRKVDMRGLSTRDALVEWGKANRYGVVFGAWAASMIGSFGYISFTPLSFTQKLVQGLTVMVLIASAGLSSIPTAAGGENDDEIRRHEREESSYKWKKGSPHDIAVHETAAHEAASHEKEFK